MRGVCNRLGVGRETIKANVDADCRFSFNRRLGQIRQVEFNDQRDMPTARHVALECRAFQGQINCLRLPDGDPTDLWNIDAAIFKFNSLRNSERLMGAVFLLEFREARPLLKEVVKRPLAIGKGLLQQLRIDLFQPLETGLALKPGQFNRKPRPGDGFAGLLISLFSMLERPVEDEPSRARITGERRLLFGGRINLEPVDLSFGHSISGPLRVDVFGNRLLGYGAGGRGEIILLGHIADNHVATRARYPIIRLSESQRRYALLRAGAKFIPLLEAEGYLWLFVSRGSSPAPLPKMRKNAPPIVAKRLGWR
jgi:hypothetical protein